MKNLKQIPLTTALIGLVLVVPLTIILTVAAIWNFRGLGEGERSLSPTESARLEAARASRMVDSASSSGEVVQSIPASGRSDATKPMAKSGPLSLEDQGRVLKNADPQLIEAVKANDIQRVRSILAGYPKDDPIFETYLITVAPSKELRMAMVEAGWNPNVTYLTGANILGGAAWQKNEDEVAYLLDHGADPNIAERYDSPLFMAAATGSTAIVKLLVEHGAYIPGGLLQFPLKYRDEEMFRIMYDNMLPEEIKEFEKIMAHAYVSKEDADFVRNVLAK